MHKLLSTALVLMVGGSTAALADDFPYGQTLDFNVFRNGQPIGRHTVTFKQDGNHRTATVSVNFAVKALGVVAYRYSHNSREVWSGNALQALDSKTDDNGVKYSVRVQRSNKGLVVDREMPASTIAVAAGAEQGAVMPPETRHEVQPAGMLPTSNWNFSQVKQSVLLNTQYGTPFRTQITPMGREPVKTASGAMIEATRYRYTGELRMDQWFDGRGRWVKAAFPAHDGSMIEYVLQE